MLIACFLLPVNSVIAATTNYQFTATGITGKPLDNVTQRLKLQKQLYPSLTKGIVWKLYKQAPQQITLALQPFGYFKPRIKSSIEQKDGIWIAHFAIDKGPPLNITHLDLQVTGDGAHDNKFKQLLGKFPIQQGQRFSTKKYDAAKSRLFNLANIRGYFDAKMLKNKIIIDMEHNRCTVIMHFDTGRRYLFGPVNFSRSPLSEHFLRKYLTFKPGNEHYKNSKLQLFQQHLANSTYFSQVVVTPVTEAAKGKLVPIHVQLTPFARRQYSYGIGYGTDTGPRGTATIKFPYVTKSGHHFDLNVYGSMYQDQLQANYNIPGKNPATDAYKISGAVQRLDQKLGESQSETLALSYLTVIKGWQQTIALTLQHERFDITSSPKTNSLMLIPSINWLKIVSDHPITPTTGYKINIMVRGASRSVLANTDFAQAEIQAKWLHPFNHYLRLIARGALGYTYVSSVDDLPYSLQFVTGGPNSVRGYAFNSLGPGRNLAVGSVELQQRIYKQIFAAAFFDAGNVSNDVLNLKRGVGVGIAWESPVGMLELTVAKALDAHGQPNRIQFSMGAMF